MTRTLLVVSVALAVVTASTLPVGSQEVVADVETWRGGSVRIVQPSLDVLYTIVPRRQVPGAAPTPSTGGSGAAGAPGATSGASSGASMIGFGLSTAPIDVTQSRDRVHTLTFVRDGIETRIPFERIADLVVERRDVASSLPPYIRPTHAQYSAKAVLTDGSTIDATSVSFGMIILRGTGPQGAIELPLEDVKTLKIKR
jgi:hypothetical protein